MEISAKVRTGSAARGVVEADFEGKNAQYTNPPMTAATMAWANQVLVV
jgi:hypothetical protein